MGQTAEPGTPSPTNCTTTQSDGDAGVVLSFPPKGVLRAYWGQLGFSTLIVVMGSSMWFLPVNSGDASLLRLVCALFTAGGLYLVVSTLRAARTRITVVAGQQRMTIEEVGPFFSTRQSWPRSQIEDVKLHGYRTACVSVGGKLIKLAVDRNREEIIKLIITARQGLGMSPRRSQRPVRPKQSQVVWNKTDDVAKIAVPSPLAHWVIVALTMSGLLSLLLWRMLNPVPGDETGPLLTMIAALAAGLIVSVLVLQMRKGCLIVFEVKGNELEVVEPFFYLAVADLNGRGNRSKT